ncbi:hypothetical protein [Segetibacter aerophilus]|uniref:Uncharacterized protein n=1 Tax=Segetibacter aerophilus TaxID=670293 RepID=A0A512B8Q2_9BACT|nr:hypothetical protein [Segetibacter aerophilus]GEO08309.1 hypothetical protein SAE01_08050 [Segetibacter aerophilus]
MEYSFTEEEISTRFYRIKGFKCLKCGSTDSKNGKKEYDRKCAECGTNYPLTANTAFHSQRIPLNKAIAMLVDAQTTYMKFLESDEYQIKEGEFDEDDDEDPLTLKWKRWQKDKKTHFYFLDNPARKSSQDLSEIFKIEKKSVQAFFSKIAQWLPDEFGNSCYADKEWFKNLKTDESKVEWTKIFNLLFRPNDYKYWELDIARELEDLLFILIHCVEPAKGKLYYIGEQYYEDLAEKENERLQKENERLQKEWEEEFERKNGYRYIP